MPKYTGIYLHIPFCRKKCNYCDFVSLTAAGGITSETEDKYLASLEKEISFFLPGKPAGGLMTLYVGGGTPSLLSEKQLSRLLDVLLNSNFIKTGKTDEFTIEVNPESASESKLKLMKDFGADRLSIGCQSFDDKILKFLGRVHTKADFLKCYDKARSAGFKNINIDLIFGIPGQSLRSWEKELEAAAELEPEHISVYSLTIEKGTKFYSDKLKKDEEMDADMYAAAIKYLKKTGYNQYEISNFSKPGFESSHNKNYWFNGEYYGFGLSAVSYIGGVRIANTSRLDKYLAGNFRENSEELSGEKKAAEGLILGLRMTAGIKPQEDALKFHSGKISELIKNGLLEKSGDKIKLTERGIMLANYVFREFL